MIRSINDQHSLMSSDAKTFVIVPAYNESTRLGKTLHSLCDHPIAAGIQIVVVDDGSKDDTSVVASGYPVWVLRHPINCGQGASLRTGIDFALSKNAVNIVTFDADGQHSPEDINRLLEPIGSGEFDVVLGSRFLGQTFGMPKMRFLMLKTAVFLTRLTSRLNITDVHNGLRAMTSAAAAELRIEQPRMAHASEILGKLGKSNLRFCEVPVTIRYTPESLAKGQTTWDAMRIGSQVLLGKFVS